MLARHFQQTVSVEPLEGQGAFGPEYGDPETVACRIEQKRRIVIDAEGEERVSDTLLFVAADAVIPEGSLVTVDGHQRTVIGVRPVRGRRNVNHLEVSVQ